ncbi:hypothetical protein PP178_02795 [Zeaxanthinibacter sp. PT1]|uniref:hypothetical protein n=1 Tax=Zeaxanthinibacter TaxID=561554 RepID=UPI00234AD59F|nr:hypothetical protein [Zeaxanthinibacter sp. PT1]MDC6350464.1 hypothetical protein [Zeaxanthinibacter sp. PT1]
MALMNDLSSNATDGEIRFANLIKDVDDDYSEFNPRLYYEPNGVGESPDFAMYSNQHGVILFEVKDFSIGVIENFNYNEMRHLGYGDSQLLSFEKCQTFNSYKNEFKKALLGNDKGIPVAKVFVFPNLFADEIDEKFGIDLITPLKGSDREEKRLASKFIFADEFEDIEQLFAKFNNIKRFRYNESDRSREIAIDKITRKIQSPVISKGRDGGIQTAMFDFNRGQNEIFVLSKYQENTLNKWLNKPGYRFLKGNAGTGKTVLIIARAQYLAERIPNCNILITYHSSSLDGVFRHLAEKYPLQIKTQRIIQFCYHKIKGDSVEDKDWSRYKKECLEILQEDELHPLRGFYDFVMVDEGQDFCADLGEIIDLITKGQNHKDKNVLVAFDNKQAINEKEAVDTVKTFAGKQRGRVKILDDSFRSPKEITIRAQRLIEEEIQSVRSVPDAFIHREVNSFADVMIEVDKLITKLLSSDRFPVEKKDIAIIYPSLGVMHHRVDKEIKKLSHPYQKHHRKQIIRPDTPSIKVLSSSYCKGLDFKVVFLIYFDEITEHGEEVIHKKAKHHLYVALTRALHYVVAVTSKRSDLMNLIIQPIEKKESA